jgi:hypothetical protein
MATRTIDRAYRRFDRGRSRVMLQWAPDGALDEFNALAYERDAVYNPQSSAFRSSLFPWEAVAIREYFTPPPGRILLGGAGGGREAFAVAEHGYDVVAFEPAPELAEAMAARAASAPRVKAFRARYEDLPRLGPAGAGGAEANVHDLGPYDAAIMGWGSFSHLPTRRARVQALASIAETTSGPVLVSFLTFAGDDTRQRRRRDRRPGGTFSIFIGYFHTLDARELHDVARAAGVELIALNTDETESPWPHAIMRRKAG